MANNSDKQSRHTTKETPTSPGAGAGVGVLPSQTIREYLAQGKITASKPLTKEQVQPASMDLRLGSTAYQIKASFIPGGHSHIMDKIDKYNLLIDEIDLTEKNILQKGCVYLVPLLEELDLPDGVYAKANPRSTVGRLDIFVRLLTERASEFDTVPPGYKGKLYLEVVPRTFSVMVQMGTRFNQLRFIRGADVISDESLSELEKSHVIVYSEDEQPQKANIREGVRLTVNLKTNQKHNLVGLKAKRNAPIIDFDKRRHYNPLNFWEPLYSEDAKDGIVLNPDDFFILTSKERVSVPPKYAAEMVAYDTNLAELRVHYAGFFDPGFGYGPNPGAVKGTPAVMEVRAHEVPFLIEDGQVIARLLYFPLTEQPEIVYGPDIGSSYQFQQLTLSKQFKRLED